MEGSSRDDIRRLLKTFGIQADESLVAHLARNPGDAPLHGRLSLPDVTDCGERPPGEPLHLELEGRIRR